MNILFIGESYIPQMCGMTSVTRYLAEGLVKEGHKITIATQSHYENDKIQEIINGVCVHRFKIDRALLKTPVGDIKSFVEFVFNSSYDAYIIECIGSLTSDILIPYIYKIKGVKILYSHGNSFPIMRPFLRRKNLKYTLGNTFVYFRLWYRNLFVFPKLVKSVDEVVILSRIASDKSIVDKYSKKYEILDNAADNMFFDEYEKNEPLNYPLRCKYDKYIISIATYTKQKNQLLMAKSYYKSDLEGVSLIMIGPRETDYYQNIVEYINEMHPKYPKKDVVMLMNVPRPKLPNILKHSSLYLVTSEYEEYSISIIEAMSLGIPFVSTNVGNARILPGGITVMKNSELPSAIAKILTDEILHDKLSKEAKEYADSHNRESIAVKRMENIINKLREQLLR